MKKSFCALFLAGLSLAALASCSTSQSSDASGSKERNYWTINLYSDYDPELMAADLAMYGRYQIASDAMPNRAVRIGYCYAMKGEAAQVTGMQMLKDPNDEGGANYNYHKSRAKAPHGYSYVFDSFKGFYDNGSAIDLAHIQSDCNIFSTFAAQKTKYVVSIEDAYRGHLYSELLEFQPYGEGTIKDCQEAWEILTEFPERDPERDPYYITYAPLSWEVTMKLDEDEYEEGDPTSLVTVIPYGDLDTLGAIRVADNLTFRPIYDDSTRKDFTVEFEYQLRTLDHYEIDGTPVYNYGDLPVAGDLPDSKVYHYGSGIDASDELRNVPNYRFVGIGANGSVARYDINDPNLPDDLKDFGSNPVQGVAINHQNIRYHCKITMVYEENFEYLVRFHNDVADPTKIEDPDDTDEVIGHLVRKGDSVKAPSILNVPVDKVATGEWTKTPGGSEVYDLSAITENVDLYPVLLEKDLSYEGLTFTLSLDRHGYELSNVDPLSGYYDDHRLEYSDFPNVTFFPEGYPWVGVSSFGDAAKTLEVILLPEEVSHIGHGILSGLQNAQTIDLSHTTITELKAYSFQNLTLLTEVRLPNSLQTVGTQLFRYASKNLTEVHLDMTQEDYESRTGFASGWNKNYDGSAFLTIVFDR